MMEMTTKKVLLPLKDPNAAPVFVTLTRVKKSGTTVRASHGLMRSQDQLLRQLIQSVKRQGEEKNELHVDDSSFRAERSAVEESRGNIECNFTGYLDFARHDHYRALTALSQRSHKSGCALLAPTVGRCRQQRAHF